MTNTGAIGDIVRCERHAPAKGTWARYAGEVGTVVVPDNYGEVGVSFEAGTRPLIHLRAESWFLPTELVLVAKQRRPSTDTAHSPLMHRSAPLPHATHCDSPRTVERPTDANQPHTQV